MSVIDQQPIGVQRDDAPARREPGQFARHPKHGAPYVAHPTETVAHSGNKAKLIALCAERGIAVPDKATVAVLKQLLGPRPRKVMYGRPSSLGKQIENQTNLQKWSERAVALGIFVDPELLTDLAHLDPEQLNLDDAMTRDLLDGIAIRAKARAQAGLAAERGTHHHELTEDHDTEADWVERVRRGEDLGVPAHVQAALVAAWARMLAEFDIEILAVEAQCVDDRWRQAGTLDRICRLRKPLRFVLVTGEYVDLPAGWVGILDIKTGKLRLDQQGFVSYWHGYAVQLASYAQSVPYDPDTDTRGTWPWPIDQRHGIIAHLDVLAALAGTATCRLVLVDLEAGREAGEHCVWARSWEARTDVFSLVVPDLVVTVPVEGHVVETTATDVDDPFAQISQQPASPFSFPGEGAPAPVEPTVTEAGVNEGMFVAPEGAPPAAEDPFAMIVAEPHTPGALAPIEPAPQPDEGPIIDDADTLLVLSRRFQALGEGVAIIRQLAVDAAAAGYPISITQLASVRRFEIGRALMALIESGCWTDDLVRALVAHVSGDLAVAQPGTPLGTAIGALSADQATRFAHLAGCFDIGSLTIEFEDDGRLVLTGPALVGA